MKERLKISVRDLIGFSYQSGDMKSVFVSQKRALAGTRAHQKIQKSRPDDYLAEVAFKYIHETEKLDIQIQGRIDGVQPGETYLIEEIKSTFRLLDEITYENSFMHWAQAKIYAFIFSKENELSNVDIKLTYYQLDDDAIREIVRPFTFIELEEFFLETIRLYYDWAIRIADQHTARDTWLQELTFPYGEFRKNQRDMSVATYNAVKNKENIFIQAPTGIGKTIGTLFPVLKAMGEGKAEKIFYLTAKTVGRTVALNTLRDVTEKHKLKSVVLTAKDKVCRFPGRRCDGDDCPLAKGYFDRQKDASVELFNYDIFERDVIDEIADKYYICPFEFSLFLSLFADVVVADYNYAFDPAVYLRRFFDPVNGDYFFLIDEAHNFPERTRGMYSADIKLGDVKKAVKALIEDAGEDIIKPLKSVERHMMKWRREMKKELQQEEVQELDKNLMRKIRKFINNAETWLARNTQTAWRQDLLDIYFVFRQFVRSSEFMNEKFTFYLSNTGKFFIKIYCMDPSEMNRESLKRAIGSVFFSATLLPEQYFTYFCGGTGDELFLKLTSPFPQENLKLLINTTVETTYQRRTDSIPEVVENIYMLSNARKGNMLVFFPSYKYMESVLEKFEEKYPDKHIQVQKRSMKEEKRLEFLAAFEPGRSLIGFAVMGGIFGEGIDLRGEKLSNCVIVGVGLPQICLERNLIRDYFDSEDKNGFDFAYKFPGLNRVMQAGGRVIRTAEDKGVILLLDRRFGGYTRLFPQEWKHYRKIMHADSIGELFSSPLWGEEGEL